LDGEERIVEMISRIYISHSRKDDALALALSRSLWRVGLESYVALYSLSAAISRSERCAFGLRNSECMIPLLTRDGCRSPDVCQEIGLARGLDLLILPLLEEGAKMPYLIEHLQPLIFREESFADAIGLLIKTIRDLSRLEWLKVTCPKCGEEMTQYLTPQEEVEAALEKGSCLETVCSYCQNEIKLDPRTFEPVP
jgi:hypothetical protein